MKKILSIIFPLFLFTVNSFASETDGHQQNMHEYERDSVFVVYIENDTTEYDTQNNRICIVFENTSNDTIVLFSKFDYYYASTPGGLGYSLFFYHNKRPVLPEWGDSFPKYYIYKGNRITEVAPKEVIKMVMSLPYFGDKERAKNNEFGVELYLRYRYYSTKDKILKPKYFKSEYLILTYR